jgi:uncharacterized protein (TIGR03435 family)
MGSPLPYVAGVTGAELKRRVAGIVAARGWMRVSWPKKVLLVVGGAVLMAPMLLGQVRASQRLLKPEASAQDKPAEQHESMARDADPSFDVATIKPADPDDRNQGFRLDGRHLRVEANTMIGILCFAYSIQKSQIVNAPQWFSEQSWNIDGVPDKEGTPSWPQYRRMLQKLLAARFGLVMHPDKRELSVYALTVTKAGPKLEKSKSEPDALSNSSGHGVGKAQYMKFTNESMADFVHVLELMGGDKPVVDQTNLPGRYDFTLLWTPDQIRATEPDAPPGLSTALQEQLGLKFESTRAATDVFVIDAATRPTEN